MKTKSNLERVLEAGQFAVTGELGPPQSADAEVIRKKAKILKGNVVVFCNSITFRICEASSEVSIGFILIILISMNQFRLVVASKQNEY